MMYFLIASVFIYRASEARQFKCSTAPSNAIANEMGLESGGSLAFYYTWNDGKVPYFFTNRVTQKDRMFIKEQMQLIESKTCVRFIEGSHFSDQDHHMEIDVEPRSCGQSWSNGLGWSRILNFNAYVQPQFPQKVLFRSHHQFTDKHFCGGSNTIISGGVIHELFHALGAIHTHQREDRERYVIYNQTCLKHPNDDNQFTIEEFNIPTDIEEIKYEFNSIMHYECDAFSWCKSGDCHCDTLEPKNGTSCSVVGSNQPTELDWKMIRQYQCGGGDSGASSSTAKTTTTTSSFDPKDLLDSQTCAKWKKWGMCREDLCAATCGGDSGTSSTTTTTTTTTTTSSFGPSDIEDWETCAFYKELGWCGEHADIRNRCAATCNEDSGTSSSTTTTSCNYEDIYDWQTCAEYKTQGWCWYYGYYCAATCNC